MSVYDAKRGKAWRKSKFNSAVKRRHLFTSSSGLWLIKPTLVYDDIRRKAWRKSKLNSPIKGEILCTFVTFYDIGKIKYFAKCHFAKVHRLRYGMQKNYNFAFRPPKDYQPYGGTLPVTGPPPPPPPLSLGMRSATHAPAVRKLRGGLPQYLPPSLAERRRHRSHPHDPGNRKIMHIKGTGWQDKAMGYLSGFSLEPLLDFNSYYSSKLKVCLIKPLLSWKDFAPRRIPICNPNAV
jgi:hypothetical protein